MSSERVSRARLLLSLSRGVALRLGACVLLSALATLCAGMYGADAAFMEFVGGGLVVPDGLGTRPGVVFLVAWLAPTAAFLYLFSDFLPARLSRQASGVLPRVGSRRRWAVAKLVQLGAISALYSMLGTLAGSAGLLALNPGAVTASHLGQAMAAALLGAPLMYALVLAANCAALKTDAVAAFASVLLVHAGTLVGVAFLPRGLAASLAPWLPSTQGVLAWHDGAGLGLPLSSGVTGFGVAPSLVYLAACCVVALVVAVRLVRRRDIV